MTQQDNPYAAWRANIGATHPDLGPGSYGPVSIPHITDKVLDDVHALVHEALGWAQAEQNAWLYGVLWDALALLEGQEPIGDKFPLEDEFPNPLPTAADVNKYGWDEARRRKAHRAATRAWPPA